MLNKSLQHPDVIQQPLLNDESFLRNLVSTVCQQLLEAEISAALQALPYERTESREGYRNGYKSRQLKTRVGKLSLEMPQDREGIYQRKLFERYQRSEKAFIKMSSPLPKGYDESPASQGKESIWRQTEGRFRGSQFGGRSCENPSSR